MTKPTKAQMARTREQLMQNLHLVESLLTNSGCMDRDTEQAWAEIMTFCAISIRVMAKTNVSKLASETRTQEIASRLAGAPVLSSD